MIEKGMSAEGMLKNPCDCERRACKRKTGDACEYEEKQKVPERTAYE